MTQLRITTIGQQQGNPYDEPMNTSPDVGLLAVLSSFGLGHGQLLGSGGEAHVFALDADRVIRVQHTGSDSDSLASRRDLVDELRHLDAPFQLPEVLSIGQLNGRHFSIEQRLPGISLLQQLARLNGHDRDLLIEHHLDAAAAIANLRLSPRGWFGELIGANALRAATWKGYLHDRARQSLDQAGTDFQSLNADALADEMPDCTAPVFVHLDACAANMLAIDTTVTAVLDIGVTSVVGDQHLDAVSGAVYLSTPYITRGATRRDADVAMSWLANHDLADHFIPSQRWLAAYWSFAVDDVELHTWCRSVLLTTSGVAQSG
jgi:aminoglycoside phosphotransferase